MVDNVLNTGICKEIFDDSELFIEKNLPVDRLPEFIKLRIALFGETNSFKIVFNKFIQCFAQKIGRVNVIFRYFIIYFCLILLLCFNNFLLDRITFSFGLYL